MKEWALFLVSIGCVLILLSSAMGTNYGGIITGVLTVVLGVMILVRKKRGGS